MQRNNGKLILLTALMFLVFSISQLKAAPSISVPTDRQGRPFFIDGQIVVRLDTAIPMYQRENIVQSLGYKVINHSPKDDLFLLQVTPGQVLEIVQVLKKNNQLKNVAPNYIAYPLSTYTPYSFPNDPNYQNGNDEWNVNQVHMDQAWNSSDPWIANASLGRPSAKIAVLDSGILQTHEEFVGKIDPNSWNFHDNNNNINDTYGHGTNVAGLASMNTNNSLGGGGMCADCSLLVVKVTAANGTADSYSLGEGIQLAYESGAKAVNISFGAPENTFSVDSSTAWQNGCIVVGAMGNDGNNTEYSPAGDSNAIGVGAIDQTENRCSFSNYGSWIELVAPVCGSVFTTSNSCVTCFTAESGTSDAAPQVSALVAILLDQGLTPAAVTQCLYTTADTLGGGFNQNTGWGQMNAYRALSAIRPPMSLTASAATNSITLNWLAPQTTAFATSDYIVSRGTVSGGPYTLVGTTPDGSTLSLTDSSPDPGTTYYYVVQAVDAKGNTTVVSNEAITLSTGPTWTPTVTETSTVTPTPTITLTPTISYTPTATPTITLTFTPTLTPTFTWTPTVTPTETPTPTATLTEVPCGYPGFTCTPTLNPSTLLYNPLAYPNPVRDKTVHFTYQLSIQAEQVTFKLFTVAYRKVAQFSGTTQDGQNSVTYDASNLANGLYWYVLEAKAGDKREQKIGKLLVLR